jgi:hypothetical protein
MICTNRNVYSTQQRMALYSASSLKQQSTDRHVAPHELIPSQPVCSLSPYCCGISGEATNTNSIVFGINKSKMNFFY